MRGDSVVEFIWYMTERSASVILAGGKSSRMGEDKASLMFYGSRLVDHVAKALTVSAITSIFVSGKIEGYAGIADVTLNKGPVGGICSSLIHCYEKNFTKVLIIPVDMPLISPAVIKLLIASSDDSAFTHFEGKPLPLAVKITEPIANFCAKTNLNLANGEEMSVKSFLKNFTRSAIKVPENLTKDLTNANTTNEWQEAQNEYQNQRKAD